MNFGRARESRFMYDLQTRTHEGGAVTIPAYQDKSGPEAMRLSERAIDGDSSILEATVGGSVLKWVKPPMQTHMRTSALRVPVASGLAHKWLHPGLRAHRGGRFGLQCTADQVRQSCSFSPIHSISAAAS